MEPGLVHDRADPGQRLAPLGRDRYPKQRHRAPVGPGQAEQGADQRGLARSVRPEVAERAPARDQQLDAVDRGVGPEPLGQAVGLQRPSPGRALERDAGSAGPGRRGTRIVGRRHAGRPGRRGRGRRRFPPGPLIGQRTLSTILLIGLEIIVTPILARVQIPYFLNGQRLDVGVAMDQLRPAALAPATGGGPGPGGLLFGGRGALQIPPMATWAMISVIVGWIVVWTVVGAWRMMTRDA